MNGRAGGNLRTLAHAVVDNEVSYHQTEVLSTPLVFGREKALNWTIWDLFASCLAMPSGKVQWHA